MNVTFPDLLRCQVLTWKTGFWGEKGYGWHYDLMLLAMNLVVLCTAGGKLVLHL